MNSTTQIFITGDSSGIGKALVYQALNNKSTKVTGISRRGLPLTDSNYNRIKVDLSSINELLSVDFSLEGVTKAILINNAGTINPIGYSGSLNSADIHKLHIVNTVAPQILCNAFIQSVKKQQHLESALILNVSSGAANKSISGWTAYSSSKAALNQYSIVLNSELAEAGFNHVKVYSIAPGVVDTEMQSVIRSKSEQDFSAVNYFKELKTNGDLVSPSLVAEKLFKIINEEYIPNDVICSVRDFE